MLETISLCQLDIALPTQSSGVIPKPTHSVIAHHFSSSNCWRLRFSLLPLSTLQVTILLLLLFWMTP